MNDFIFVQLAKAEENETGTAVADHEAVAAEAHEGGGLSIQPSVVLFQLINFTILVLLLTKILYKPLVKLLEEREKKIKDGVINAEKAETLLKESNQIHRDMMKKTQVETHTLVEKARQEAEGVKTGIVEDAHVQADKIIRAGHHLVETEKAKTVQDLKAMAANLIIKAAEKVLKEKIDPDKDSKMIMESLNNFS